MHEEPSTFSIVQTDSSNLAAAIKKLSKEVEQLKFEQENRRLQEYRGRNRSRHRPNSRSNTWILPGFVNNPSVDVEDDMC